MSVGCFNPRPGHATGATSSILRGRRSTPSFNPRPGHATGATSVDQSGVNGKSGFNPRPGHATGATQRAPLTARCVQVSIRAPVTRPGRHVQYAATAGFNLFQSAPRSRDRGDPLCPRWVIRITGFNPRPGHATGATHCSCGTVTKVSVSIRAPVTRPGRLNQISAGLPANRFQSAPRSRDRGDIVSDRIEPSPTGFNPRPGHATGATEQRRVLCRVFQVSIRAPVTRPGRRSP